MAQSFLRPPHTLEKSSENLPIWSGPANFLMCMETSWQMSGKEGSGMFNFNTWSSIKISGHKRCLAAAFFSLHTENTCMLGQAENACIRGNFFGIGVSRISYWQCMGTFECWNNLHYTYSRHNMQPDSIWNTQDQEHRWKKKNRVKDMGNRFWTPMNIIVMHLQLLSVPSLWNIKGVIPYHLLTCYREVSPAQNPLKWAMADETTPFRVYSHMADLLLECMWLSHTFWMGFADIHANAFRMYETDWG